MSTIDEILERLSQIQTEMDNLIAESANLYTTLREDISFEKSRKGKPKNDFFKQHLEKFGYQIKSANNGSRYWIISKDGRSWNIMVKSSTYHGEKDFNMWYTINKNVEDFIDCVIFLFNDSEGNPHWIGINNLDLGKMLKKITKMPDGRTNIRFRYFNQQVLEIESRVDFSDSLDSMQIIKELSY